MNLGVLFDGSFSSQNFSFYQSEEYKALNRGISALTEQIRHIIAPAHIEPADQLMTQYMLHNIWRQKLIFKLDLQSA